LEQGVWNFKNVLENQLKAKHFIFLLTLFLVAFSSRVLAQTKIGFVNLSRVLREAPVAQRAEKKLEQEFSKRNQDLMKMSEQLKKMQENLEKNAMTLADSDRQKQEKDFADLNREFQRKQREFQEDLTQRRNDELSGVLQRVEQVVLQIAKTEQYDLMLRDGQVVWASNGIDITDRVVKALEEGRAGQASPPPAGSAK
jgi:outer membrane protein